MARLYEVTGPSVCAPNGIRIFKRLFGMRRNNDVNSRDTLRELGIGEKAEMVQGDDDVRVRTQLLDEAFRDGRIPIIMNKYSIIRPFGLLVAGIETGGNQPENRYLDAAHAIANIR
jgi:hypothetical protein